MIRLWILLGWLLCGPLQAATPAQTSPAEEADSEPAALAFSSDQLAQPLLGDLDAMLARRTIRVLTTYNKTGYFIYKGVQRGVTYDAFIEVEKRLNEQLRKQKSLKRHLKLHLVFIPVAREALLEALIAGKGDIAAANLTITERRKLQGVLFTDPLLENVRELLISGQPPPRWRAPPIWPANGSMCAPPPATSRASRPTTRRARRRESRLSTSNPPRRRWRMKIWWRWSMPACCPSSLWTSTRPGSGRRSSPPSASMNSRCSAKGGHRLGGAQGEPQLLAMLNEQIAALRGKHSGDAILARYLKQNKFVKSAAADAERQKFLQVVDLFREYGEKYEVDWLLMAAQGYQESALNHKARSHVGAIGIMQIMPATGKGLKVGDIRQLEPNIHGGVKYMRWMIDHYYADEPMTALDKALFSFASYNAGPARVARLRNEAKRRGLDPNVWFHNVEYVAAEKIGPETVTYVGNIYKYYIAYKLVMEQLQRRQQATEAIKQQGTAGDKVSAAPASQG